MLGGWDGGQSGWQGWRWGRVRGANYKQAACAHRTAAAGLPRSAVRCGALPTSAAQGACMHVSRVSVTRCVTSADGRTGGGRGQAAAWRGVGGSAWCPGWLRAGCDADARPQLGSRCPARRPCTAPVRVVGPSPAQPGLVWLSRAGHKHAARRVAVAARQHCMPPSLLPCLATRLIPTASAFLMTPIICPRAAGRSSPSLMLLFMRDCCPPCQLPRPLRRPPGPPHLPGPSAWPVPARRRTPRAPAPACSPICDSASRLSANSVPAHSDACYSCPVPASQPASQHVHTSPGSPQLVLHALRQLPAHHRASSQARVSSIEHRAAELKPRNPRAASSSAPIIDRASSFKLHAPRAARPRPSDCRPTVPLQHLPDTMARR